MSASNMGRPKAPPKPRKMLKEIVPVSDIFSPEELEIYKSLVDIYMADFDEEDLTSADIDDIMVLATNKVLEIRLLKSSKDDVDKQLDISTSIEKLRKQTEKIKENLSARRKDRINPNEYKGFSIVDLAVAFDQAKRAKLENKARELKQEQDEALALLKQNPVNRFDIDGEEMKKNDN